MEDGLKRSSTYPPYPPAGLHFLVGEITTHTPPVEKRLAPIIFCRLPKETPYLTR